MLVWCTVVTMAPAALAIDSNSSTLPPTPKYNTLAATRIVGLFAAFIELELEPVLSLPTKDANMLCGFSGSVRVAFDNTDNREGTFAVRYIVSEVITRS